MAGTLAPAVAVPIASRFIGTFHRFRPSNGDDISKVNGHMDEQTTGPIPEIGPARDWAPAGTFTDIRYETAEGIAKITIDRPEVRNAFRPLTTKELIRAFEIARDDPMVGVIVLTGQGSLAFCSGGDQKVRGDDGYVDDEGIGRLNVLDLQIQIRRLPKPVVAMVAGFAIGGGHVLHLCCDLTIAADNARFGQTGPRVARSTAATASTSWPGRSARNGPRRCGSSAGSTTRRRRSVGSDQRSRAGRRPRARHGGVVPGDARVLAARPAAAEGGVERGHRWPGGRAAARRRRHPLLHERGSAGRPRRLHGEAAPDFSRFPQAAVSAGAGAPPGEMSARADALRRPLVARRPPARSAPALCPSCWAPPWPVS